MNIKAAFIFLSPDADPSVTKGIVKTESVELSVIGASNYTEAVDVVSRLIDQGVTSIELCGGFGLIGTARIAESVKSNISVGAVRFDCHPGLDGASGDSIFAN